MVMIENWKIKTLSIQNSNLLFQKWHLNLQTLQQNRYLQSHLNIYKYITTKCHKSNFNLPSFSVKYMRSDSVCSQIVSSALSHI